MAEWRSPFVRGQGELFEALLLGTLGRGDNNHRGAQRLRTGGRLIQPIVPVQQLRAHVQDARSAGRRYKADGCG